MKIKNIFVAFILALCLMASGFSAFAEPEDTEIETEAEEQEEKEEPTEDKNGRPILPDRETAILVDAKSGIVLYEKDSDKKMYPASTTKAMTALLVVEAIESGQIKLEDVITVTEEALEGLAEDGSGINLKVGEEISVKSLLYGLMVASGNDAANVLATAVSGSVDAFVEKMNARSAELGLENTHFVNPHGLHDENHYSTAADLARIAKEGMKNENFYNAVNVAHIKIPPTNLSEERYYINTNGLMSAMRYREYHYKDSVGVKTGHTSDAGYCLISAAKRGSLMLIGVVLNGEDVSNSHRDSIRILDYGFDNFKTVTAVTKGDMLSEIRVKQGARGVDHVTLSAADDVAVTVPKNAKEDSLNLKFEMAEAVYAPISQGQTLAEVIVYYNGNELGRGTLISDAEVKRHPLGFLMSIGEALWSVLIIRLICYVLMIAAGWFVILFIYKFYKEIKAARSYRRYRKKR